MTKRRNFALLALALLAVGCSGQFASRDSQEIPLASPTRILATATTAVPEPTMSPEGREPASPTPTPPPSHQGLPDPNDYQWSLLQEGFQQPIGIEVDPEGRLFVLEQPGIIRVVEASTTLQTPFLDIRDRVSDAGSEQGLLGMALHPDYLQNGRFFLNYTNRSGDSVIAEYSRGGDPTTADPASERILLQFQQPYRNHNGGGLAFGADGYLYIGTGDGGSANDPHDNGQSLNTLLGKILRIDVEGGNPYEIPPDNPFLQDDDARPEIWAYGLRNPWRFSFDPLTQDLYIGDVGQNQWEEIDHLPAEAPAGANFGWNLREGSHNFAGGSAEGLIDPVAEYSHQHGCSVTGGVVVRDPSLPDWSGVYLYGDYCTGVIWGLVRDVDGSWRNQRLFDTRFNITTFGYGPERAVLVADHQGGIYQLQPLQP